MLDLLTDTEKEIMYMLIQGQNFNGISDFIGIDYQEYITLKKSIFKKLHITRIIQILPLLLSNGLEYAI